MDSDSFSRSTSSYTSESDDYDRAPVKSSVAELQIKHLESEIADDPTSGQAWKKKIELINLYRKNGNLSEARKIRSTLADAYPLSEKLWLEWIDDEQKKAETDEEQDYVSSLYKKAVEDYISVDIWVKRVDWEYTVVLERNATPTSVDFDKIRSLYESAIVSCGLHFTQGHKLWKAYVDFEKSMLSEVNNNDEKAFSVQIGKIRNLYKRQVALPFKHLDSITTDYQNWEDSLGDNKVVCQLSNAAVNQAKEKLVFEEKISDTFDGVGEVDYSQFGEWKKYLQAEEEKNESIPRIKCLYERAIRNYFLDFDIWKKYLAFLEKVQSSNLKLVFPQYERALRNCPHPDFWIIYMLTLEKLESDITEVYTIFQRSFASGSGVSTEEDYILVFETYLDIKLRYTKAMALTQDPRPLIEEYRQLCDWCINSTTHFPIFTARIKQHWAHVEVYIFRENVDKVVELYDDLLAKNPKDSELWQDAINCLLFFNDIEKCRNFFKRAVNSVLLAESLQVLFNLWAAFERISGNAETLALCKERLQKWQEIEAEKRRQEEEIRLKEEASMKVLQRKRKLSASESKDHFERNYKTAKLDNESAKENDKQESKKPFAPIKKETTQQPKSELQPKVNAKTEEKQPLKAETNGEKKSEEKQTAKLEPIVVEKKSEEVKEESNGMDEEKPTEPEAPKKRFDDKMTVFFNNVPFKATEEEIKAFLGAGGAPVKEVRLALDKNTGKFRGFGYADFENAEDRQKCIEDCNGKKYPNSQAKVKVEISNPPTVTKPVAKPANPYLAHTEKPRGGRSFNSNRTPYINKNNNSHSSHRG
jgi:RNA recognition motif-containing protein